MEGAGARVQEEDKGQDTACRVAKSKKESGS